jgi:hypothetical protein
MLFTTATQWVAVAVVFVAGWLLGLASHPGGRRWKDRYAAERDAHAAARRDADARVAEAERRRAELEREHARLARAAPATVGPAPVAAAAARPAYVREPGERRGWFDWGPRRA